MYFSDYDKYVETHEFVVSLKIKEKINCAYYTHRVNLNTTYLQEYLSYNF